MAPRQLSGPRNVCHFLGSRLAQRYTEVHYWLVLANHIGSGDYPSVPMHVRMMGGAEKAAYHSQIHSDAGTTWTALPVHYSDKVT